MPPKAQLSARKKTALLRKWQEEATYFEGTSGGQPSQWADYLHGV